MTDTLKTSAENLNLIASMGFDLYRTCHCRGTYWEKFKNKTGDKLHLAVFKGYFILYLGAIPTKGSISSELEHTLKAIYEAEKPTEKEG